MCSSGAKEEQEEEDDDDELLKSLEGEDGDEDKTEKVKREIKYFKRKERLHFDLQMLQFLENIKDSDEEY